MSPTARVGLFMLVALAILGVFIVMIEEIPLGAKGGRTRIKAAFPSVAGLDAKSPVRIAGVRIGIVEDIALDGTQAMVTLALDPNVKLYQGARAEITSLGMLGDKYVEVIPGDAAAPVLGPGAVLRGVSPSGFDQLLRTADDIGSDVKAVTTTLRASLGGAQGQQRLDEIIDNIRLLTAELKAAVAANRSNVDATLANFRDFSQTLKTELPRLADKLNALADRVDAVVAENRGNLSDSMANIKDVSGRLKISADNINQISGRIARGEGSIGKLVNDEKTVDTLNSTLKSVESGVESLKSTLGRADKWKLDLNLRSEFLPGLPESRTSRTAFGLDLHTSSLRFFRIEMVSTPFGRDSDRTETTTVTLPDGRQEVTTTRIYSETDSSSFNAQVGYHHGPYTLRAGLFESTGGVGIDRTMLDDKLKFTLEAYSFSRDTKPPHIRFEGRYLLTPHIFAFTGIDDPMWKERRSVLFGAGVTWGDDDVKYLLGTAAAAGGR